MKKFAKAKNYQRVGEHYHFTRKYRGTAHSLCNLRFNVLNEIPVVFHNGSNYDYYFILKELANAFARKMSWENTKMYKTLSLSTGKEIAKIW